MSEWMKHIHWKNVLISGSIAAVCTILLLQIEAVFTMKWYMDPAYFSVWSTVMLPNAGPPPAAFYGISLLFTLATACTMAAVFDFMKTLFGKGYWQRVIGFTDIMVGLMIVFMYFPMYLMVRLPLPLLGVWLMTGFVSVFVSAMIFAGRLRK